MPKTVQIRDLDDEVYAALARRAAEAGVGVPELLRAEATRLAARPTMTEWLNAPGGVPRRSTEPRPWRLPTRRADRGRSSPRSLTLRPRRRPRRSSELRAR